MKIPGKISNQHIIRLRTALSLIFFAWLSAISCTQQPGSNIALVWKDSIPEAISISPQLLNNDENYKTPAEIEVRLQDNTTAILGNFKSSGEGISFKPLIPFTPGMKYEVWQHGKMIGRFTIPQKAESKAPSLIAIYPSADTLPANLLKFYFKFSAPMREGYALQHIHLLNEHADTIPNIFLQLQPELWNADRTELTVWIDPGRIKRELIPNKQMGNPLHTGQQYTLQVQGDWKNAQGMSLQKSFRKTFIVGERDSVLPDPGKWSILVPEAKTKESVKISFPEPHDYFLLHECLAFLDEKGNTIKGELRVTGKETEIEFVPLLSWQPGNYRVRIDAKLEDLTGNNLNRPFDRDISIQRSTTEKAYFDRLFKIDP